MTWKNSDIKQYSTIDFYSWQNTEQISCTDFLRIKSLDTTCSAYGIKLVHNNDGSVHSPDTRFTGLVNR